MKDSIEVHEEYIEKQVHEAYKYAVQKSLLTPTGKACLDAARAKLQEDFAAGEFNTVNALELVKQAVEKAVLNCNEAGWGQAVLSEVRDLGIVSKIAGEILDQFINFTGAFDQRPERNGLAALIWGK